MESVANMTASARDPHAELFAALAKAQGEFRPIEKNREVEIQMRTGGRYKFRYADLEEILSKTRPALAANGLALIQRLEPTEAGTILSCVLTHAAGFQVVSSHQLPKNADADPKAFGAMISYFRRYLVTAMLGVAADDDLDQDGQEAQPQKPASNRKPAPAQTPPEAELLTEEEQANITALAQEVGKSLKDICSAYKVGSLGFIKRAAYNSIIKRLESARNQEGNAA